MTDGQAQGRVVVLWTLLTLFVLRVLGQLLVACGLALFLPPMQEWFSGAIPYPWLLFSQSIIILLYGTVCLHITRGRGFFARPRRGLGVGLFVFGSIYLAVMLIRYGIRMRLYPHERWIGGSIPIFFHWVLASFLLMASTYHLGQTRDHVRRRARVSMSRRWVVRTSWFIGGLSVAAGIGLWIRLQIAPRDVLSRRRVLIGERTLLGHVECERSGRAALSRHAAARLCGRSIT